MVSCILAAVSKMGFVINNGIFKSYEANRDIAWPFWLRIGEKGGKFKVDNTARMSA